MRRAEVFFYGLFMDEDILRGKGLTPQDQELAAVDGMALRIGERAALVAAPGKRVYGVLMSLSLPELDRLYSEPGVQAYRPEPVLVRLASGGTIAALCYNLPQPPGPNEHNAEYAAKLRKVAQKVGLPPEYIASLE
jgi:hypothetical protein